MPRPTFDIDFVEGSARELMWMDPTLRSGPFRTPAAEEAFAIVRVSFDVPWHTWGERIRA
jgi:hypothetical protein